MCVYIYIHIILYVYTIHNIIIIYIYSIILYIYKLYTYIYIYTIPTDGLIYIYIYILSLHLDLLEFEVAGTQGERLSSILAATLCITTSIRRVARGWIAAHLASGDGSKPFKLLGLLGKIGGQNLTLSFQGQTLALVNASCLQTPKNRRVFSR